MEKKRIWGDARFKFKSDPLSKWEANNPVLLSGEFGVVNGLKEAGDGLENKAQKVKIGDGIHDWNTLDWWYGSEGVGNSINVDQTYNPESPNAQSGKAVAEALLPLDGSNGENFANAIKGAAQGQTVVLDDISPIEHGLKVKLFAEPKEGNIYTPVPADVSKIKDKHGVSIGNKKTLEFTKENNTYSIASLRELCVDENGKCPLAVGDTLVIKYKYDSVPNCVYDSHSLDLGIFDILYKTATFRFNFKTADTSGNYATECVSDPFTVEDDYLLNIGINLTIECPSDDFTITFSEFQVMKVSRGTINPDYTKMVLIAEGETEKATYTPQADGTVLGVRSQYPTLKLSTQNGSATIICEEYNKDTDSALKEAVEQTLAVTKKDTSYEIIEEFTVAEGNSFRQFLRDEEPNGTPYNFKHLLIKCVTKKSAKFSGMYADLRENTSIPCILYMGNFIATDTDRTTYIKFDSENGRIFTQAFNSNSSTANGNPTVSLNAFGRVAGNIKGFQIRLSSSDTTSMFPVGSTITILGVRA